MAVKGIQNPGSGFSSSSPPRSECPPVSLLEINAQDSRISDALKRLRLEIDILSHRTDSLEDRLEQPALQIQKVQDQVNALDHRLEQLQYETQTAKKIATEPLAARQHPVRQINWLSLNLGARAILHQSSPWQQRDRTHPPDLPTSTKYEPHAALQPWTENEPRYRTAGRKVPKTTRTAVKPAANSNTNTSNKESEADEPILADSQG
ncbi:hypothetical protein MMC07_006832 [Pseudocyphellaria aurata]|nr:hypothetical protein [Pseudocyphellaria aurata]